jgi:hypothetical protein
VPLPAELAGYGRRDALPSVSAAGVYGTGLSSFVVVALPGRFGAAAFEQISTYGQEVPAPGGSQAALIATGLLNLLVVRDPYRTYLVAGAVAPALLERVAIALAEAPT